MIKFLKHLQTSLQSQRGSIVQNIIVGVVGVVVIGAILVALWPTFIGTGTSVAALTQTDTGTKTLQAIWPIVLVVGGIGISIAALMYILHKFGLFDL